MINYQDIKALRESMIQLRNNTLLQSAFWENEVAVLENVHHSDMPRQPYQLDTAIFAVCTAGTCTAIIDNRSYTFGANSLIALFPKQIIQTISISEDFAMYLFCISSTRNQAVINRLHDIVPLLMYVRQNPITEIGPGYVEWGRQLCKLCLTAFGKMESPFRTQAFDSMLTTLYYAVANTFGDKLATNPLQNNRQEEIFIQFIDELEKNYIQHREVSFYAKQLCVTPKYLSSVVKDVSGRSAGLCIDSYVAEEAKRLLRETHLSVLEVSQQLNFPNQSFFGKYFKRMVGCSPFQYRKSTR